MTDPNNPLNLLLTLETALHKSHKGRWPNNVRNAVQGLRRALAARYETPAGLVYGSIDACASVQRKFAWSAPIETAPIPMILFCPMCGVQHIDMDQSIPITTMESERLNHTVTWSNPPHRSHLCRACGCVWRPADVATTGVAEIETKGKADNFEKVRMYARGGRIPAQPRGRGSIRGMSFQATGSPCPDCGAEAGRRCEDGCPALL